MIKKSRSVLSAISQTMPELTKAEAKIAAFISENPEKVVTMSASGLAEASGTAGSAVIRCCHSLGFEGYAELKMLLAVELSKNHSVGYSPYIDQNDSPDKILEKVFSAGIKTLTDTLSSIDRNVFTKAVDSLAAARHIYVYGIGTSAPLVTDCAYRLTQIGCFALGVTDVPSMKISTLNIEKGDAAIAISHSGRTNATIDAIELAKERGAVTIALTSAPKSRLSGICDLPLPISTDEIRYPIEAISARIAHVCLIDSLVTAISSKDYEKALERSKLSHEIIDSTIRGNKF